MDTRPKPGQLLTLAEAYARGLSASAVQRRTRRGEWQIVLPDVLLTRAGPMTAEEKRRAALLWAGVGAALCAQTAATVDGLKGYSTPEVHVAVPLERGLRSRAFVVVHRTGLLNDAHVHPRRRPRRVRIQRAVIDIATEARKLEDAIAVVAAALQQRLTLADHLRATVEDFPRARWRAEILDALRDLEGGSHSLPELQAYRALQAAGLPLPSRQETRFENGRRRYLDLYWDQYGFCIEIDGAFHLSVENSWADAERDADLTLDGIKVFHVPAFVVRHHPQRFVGLVARAMLAAA